VAGDFGEFEVKLSTKAARLFGGTSLILAMSLCHAAFAGPIGSGDVKASAQDNQLLSIYSVCTQSMRDQICVNSPAAAKRYVQTFPFGHNLAAGAPSFSSRANGLSIRPTAFASPLTDWIEIGPDGFLLAGYASTAKLHRLRQSITD
tara:strand:+ start:264 stop:704 length:441 start_codon:yes stop_codon:yes gene_type:complete